jgi:hypothetical protein
VANELAKPTLTGRVVDRWVLEILIRWAAGKDGDEGAKARITDEMHDFANDLAGPSPVSAVERSLIEGAALDWLFLRISQAHNVGGYIGENRLTFAASEHGQRRVDRAHRRLLATLKTLATVRRLGVPAFQINVGAQQVSVAGTS